jgi:hypothetical protein
LAVWQEESVDAQADQETEVAERKSGQRQSVEGIDMRLSACITINARSATDLELVFDSMRDQAHDEFIIVLDAPTPDIAHYCRTYWEDDQRTVFMPIDRPPGWRSPVKAWNVGYSRVTGDLLYCFSSETVQQPGNVAKAKAMLEQEPAVIFGKAECSCGPDGQEVYWGGTAPGNLLSNAAHPRPLGFIWAAPMPNVRKMGGWDETFDRGLWFDESDFFYRLWRTGLNFVFDDAIAGTHLHHARPGLETPEGKAAIQTNLAYITAKLGSTNPIADLPKIISANPTHPGRTVWKHLA